MSNAGKAHMGRVAQLPCALCGAKSFVQVHHILEGRTPGRRSSDWLTIPLCITCHTGQNGIHGDKALFNVFHATELGLLAETLEALYGGRRP